MIRKVCFLIITMYILSVISVATVEADDLVEKRILISVKPNTIALPGNQVTKVPISAARVRSTELRQLNKQYDVKKIEKLFKLEGTPGNINDLFTNKERKKQIESGATVVEAQDSYLLYFKVVSDADMTGLIGAYYQLPSVMYAEEILMDEKK